MKTNRAGEPLYSEILANLFMGGTEPSEIVKFPQRLSLLGEPREFDSVATFYAYAQPMPWFVHEFRFGFEDARVSSEVEEQVFAVAKWLHSEWKQGKKVLSRCEMGWNRSGLCLGFVLMLEGYSAEDAVSLIREKRSPDALSNRHFVLALEKFFEILKLDRAFATDPNPDVLKKLTA